MYDDDHICRGVYDHSRHDDAYDHNFYSFDAYGHDYDNDDVSLHHHCPTIHLKKYPLLQMNSHQMTSSYEIFSTLICGVCVIYEKREKKVHNEKTTLHTYF